MRDFGSIVGVWLPTVNHVAKDGSYGSGVASQFIGNDPHWFGTLATQEFSKEPFCGALITIRLDQNVDHLPVLIDTTPQILLQPVDSNKDLIQVPVVAEPALSLLQFPRLVRTEFLTPLPDRFIGHDDSPLGEKILDISKAQAKAMVSPDRIADDLARETIAGVRRRVAFHDTSFSGFSELTMPSHLLTKPSALIDAGIKEVRPKHRGKSNQRVNTEGVSAPHSDRDSLRHALQRARNLGLLIYEEA